MFTGPAGPVKVFFYSTGPKPFKEIFTGLAASGLGTTVNAEPCNTFDHNFGTRYDFTKYL